MKTKIITSLMTSTMALGLFATTAPVLAAEPANDDSIVTAEILESDDALSIEADSVSFGQLKINSDLTGLTAKQLVDGAETEDSPTVVVTDHTGNPSDVSWQVTVKSTNYDVASKTLNFGIVLDGQETIDTITGDEAQIAEGPSALSSQTFEAEYGNLYWGEKPVKGNWTNNLVWTISPSI